MQVPAAGSAYDLNNAYDNFFFNCAQATNSMKRKKCDQHPGCAKVEKQLKEALGPEKNNYKVVKLTQSGSDAVMVVCLDATEERARHVRGGRRNVIGVHEHQWCRHTRGNACK